MRAVNVRPQFYISGTRDNPPLKATSSSVNMWKHCLWSPSQSWPCTTIHNPHLVISLIRWGFLDHSIKVGIAEFSNFHFLRIRISALNPKSRHFGTLAKPRIVSARRAKCLYEEKLSPLPGLPYLARRDNSPTRVVSPPVFAILLQTVGWILPRNKWQGYFAERIVSGNRDKINGAKKLRPLLRVSKGP